MPKATTSWFSRGPAAPAADEPAALEAAAPEGDGPDGGPDDWVPLAYADTPKALWPIAKRSLLAHVERIQALGLAA